MTLSWAIMQFCRAKTLDVSDDSHASGGPQATYVSVSISVYLYLQLHTAHGDMDTG